MGRRAAAALVALLALAAPPARAHEGPPYPILNDREAGPFLLSVWADPDVGIGTFYVYLEPLDDAPLPADTTVRIHVQPVSERVPETAHDTSPRPARGDQLQFLGEVPFDSQEWWHVRLELASSRGGGAVATDVEVTPPGQGPVLDFALYLFPFVAVGFLFILAVVKRRRAPERSA